MVQKICPLPPIWAKIHQELCEFSNEHLCQPSNPPKPLILAGWNFTDDKDKLQRWNDTVLWAKSNNCEYIVSVIVENEWYFA